MEPQEPPSPQRTSRPPAVALLALHAVGALALACSPDGGGVGPDSAGFELLAPEGGRSVQGVEEVEGQAARRPYYHDFGTVSVDAIVQHTFRMRNAADRTLSILEVAPGCGCTVPTLGYRTADGSFVAGEPIGSDAPALLEVPAGAVAEITIRTAAHEVRPRNNDRLYTTRVTTDSPATPFFSLETHILVEEPFQVVPGRLDVGRVPENGGGRASVDVVPVPGFRWEVEGVVESPEWAEVEVVEELRNGRRLWVLSAELLPPVPLGSHRGDVVLGTANSDGETGRIDFQLSAHSVPDVQADPARLVLRAPPAGSEARPARVVVSSLLPGHRLRILGVSLEGEAAERLAAEFQPLEVDGSGRSKAWSLELGSTGPIEGALARGTARVLLDDPQTPELTVPYVVHGG